VSLGLCDWPIGRAAAVAGTTRGRPHGGSLSVVLSRGEVEEEKATRWTISSQRELLIQYYHRRPSRKDRLRILVQLLKDDRLSREVSIDRVGVHHVDDERSRQLGGARRPRARG
jgi:hypothetical protein